MDNFKKTTVYDENIKVTATDNTNSIKTMSEAEKKQTVIDELIQYCIENAFNIEGQDGVKYIAIDYEDFRENFDNYKEKHKQEIIEAYNSSQTSSINTANGVLKALGKDAVFKFSEKEAEQYYLETYKY